MSDASPPVPAQISRKTPEQVRVRLETWSGYHRTWWMIHYAIGLIGIIAAGISGSLSGDQYEQVRVVAAILSAVAIASIAFLSPALRARSYLAAWRVLVAQHVRYELDPEYPLSKLLDAMDHGEAIIQESDPK